MGSGTIEIITGRERQRRWSVADKLRILKDALQFGSVGLNDVVTHPPEVPLGGWKESGYGTEGGTEILAPYQKTKFVSAR